MTLNRGAGLYFQAAGNRQERILHPARVVGMTEGRLTVRTEHQELAGDLEAERLATGREVVLYYERARRFTQRSARITNLLQTELGLVLELEVAGPPASAECRETYRVSTLFADVNVKLGSEALCPVHDISVTGLAVVANAQHRRGQQITVTLRHEDEEFSGPVWVRNTRPTKDGRMRYGLECSAREHAAFRLRQGLQRVTMAVQREQLRRRAGRR